MNPWDTAVPAAATTITLGIYTLNNLIYSRGFMKTEELFLMDCFHDNKWQ